MLFECQMMLVYIYNLVQLSILNLMSIYSIKKEKKNAIHEQISELKILNTYTVCYYNPSVRITA